MAHYPATGLLMTTPRFSLVHRTAVASVAQALVKRFIKTYSVGFVFCYTPVMAGKSKRPKLTMERDELERLQHLRQAPTAPLR